MSNIFITPGGIYGNADELVIINVDDWSDSDWNVFMEVADHGIAHDTIDVAQSLNERANG